MKKEKSQDARVNSMDIISDLVSKGMEERLNITSSYNEDSVGLISIQLRETGGEGFDIYTLEAETEMMNEKNETRLTHIYISENEARQIISFMNKYTNNLK